MGTSAAHAELVQLETLSKQVAFEGRQFGNVGAYELIRAVAHYRVDPRVPVNAGIVNIHRAPPGDDGRVSFDTDLLILKPVDMQRGNAGLVYEMVNRGRPLGLPLLNRVPAGAGRGDFTAAAEGGDGLVFEAGYTYVMSGWQAEYPLQDAPPMAVGLGSRLPRPANSTALSARLPIAQERNAASVVGNTREQFFDIGPASPFIGYLTYPAVDLEAGRELTTRERDGDSPRVIPSSDWRLRDPWRIEFTKPAKASAGAVYEFVYRARDPVVYGLALASMRDLVSFLRYSKAGDNPLHGSGKRAIEHTIGFGASQTGRTLKELISEFNEDEAGRIVLDGAFVLISGAGRNSINSAFSRPGLKDAQHTSWGLRGDEFPFSYPVTYDTLSRRSDGVLARCQATRTCPRIIHLDSENELWHGGTLTYVDTAGRDLTMPDTVRVFALAGTEHNATPRAGAIPPLCAAPGPTSIEWASFARALFVALDRWVAHDQLPPANRYPTVARGELVSRTSYAFPHLREVTYGGAFSTRRLYDFSQEPPRAIADYPSLVPQVDADGQMIGGVRHPFVTAPLSTNVGWNVRKPGFGDGDLCMASGMSIPFPATPTERAANQDPRQAIAERYASEAEYVKAVSRAARQLVDQRLLLTDDAQAIIAAASGHYRNAMAHK
ncbi:alpha/beta hydrolase domain-containing protein [Povalibacter sp.]|uniref:alpha/beta hydrolase domain-containing protein n=1 Tax=Povalibacter sp. TaxID=1962978 RepID=UPI002F3FCCE9